MRELFVVSLFFLLACESPYGTPPQPGAPAALKVLEGDAQSGEVGEELQGMLTARALDAAGTPVPEVVISWRGDGTPLATVTSTDQAGITQNRWILGTRAGTQKLEARVVEPIPAGVWVQASFTATARPGSPAAGLLFDDCTGVGSPGDTVSLRSSASLRDRYGNEIADWKFRPFPTSVLYAVLPDSQGIATVAGQSGIDSVQVVAAGAVVRTTHVYVRHPQIQSVLMIFSWRRIGGLYDCPGSWPRP